ncbi:MAG: glycosyltransferase family 4 protein [Anaerolineales bacterium]
MRIGVDASRAAAARRTGTESYARYLTQALLNQAPEHEFILYFRDRPVPGLFTRGASRVIPFPRLWTHARLSLELLAQPRPDVLFVPAHVLPLIHPLPSVVTVHDLGYRYFPEAHPRAQRWYLDWSTRFSARAATHLIADSISTQRDLTRLYHVPADKITVVYPGRDESFHRIDPAPIRAKYNLPGAYLLHVGTLQPRKNLIRLIEAFQHATIRGESPSRPNHHDLGRKPFAAKSPPVTLVLAGRPGWLSAPILAKVREHAPLVRHLDDVPDDDLAGLYSGATAFVFPSLYEGFGFPVLEAMACGAPVLCSNTSSLPEVAGEAALLVEPTDTAALASAIAHILSDADLRAVLAEKGFAQMQKFSWARAARETLRVLERTGTEGTKRN